VDLKATVRLAPFSNAMPLGFHYYLAHGDEPVPNERIKLADFVGEKKSLEHLLDKGVYVFYTSKDVAEQLKSSQDEGGSYDSVAVTRYRPRFAFLDKSSALSPAIEKATHLEAGFFQSIVHEGLSIRVSSDAIPQAKALMTKASATSGPLRIRHYHADQPWPQGCCEPDEKTLPIFFHGSPCTEHMLRDEGLYKALEIADDVVSDDPRFETHVAWRIPDGRGASLKSRNIRDLLTAYHKQLFEAAEAVENDAAFAVLGDACTQLLSVWHPNYCCGVFASGRAFRTALIDHHLPAPPATPT
jgi:hypothetical protein